MNAPILRLLLAGAVLTIPFSATATAEQVCHSATIASTTTTWSNNLVVPLFNPNLGALKKVTFTLTGDATGGAAVENRDHRPMTTHATFRCRVTLYRPDGSQLVVALPTAEFNDQLASYDGIDDFAGLSGASHQGIHAEKAETVSTTALADLVLFTQHVGGDMAISLPVTAMGESFVSGGGNLLARFGQVAGASLSVCYNYVRDCNHNGIADARDLMNGTSLDLDGNGVPDECDPLAEPQCFGDGPINGGPDCPCSNNTLAMAQEGCLNSSGQGAKITATGIPSVSNDTLLITASGLPHYTHSYFLRGTAQANGGLGTPYGDGLLCVGGNVLILAKIPPGGFNTLPQPGDPPISQLLGLQVGSTLYVQMRFRNVNGPCGYGFGTSNALKITYGY